MLLCCFSIKCKRIWLKAFKWVTIHHHRSRDFTETQHRSTLKVCNLSSSWPYLRSTYLLACDLNRTPLYMLEWLCNIFYLERKLKQIYIFYFNKYIFYFCFKIFRKFLPLLGHFQIQTWSYCAISLSQIFRKIHSWSFSCED